MEQNYSQVASPQLQSEDYDDFKRWQERQRGTGRKFRTAVLLAFSCVMYYLEYSAMKMRQDQVLAQYSVLKAQYSDLKAQYDRIEAKRDETLARYSALKAQYDQIEATRNESLAQYCASEAQHTGINANKSDNIPNSLKTPQ
jgi:cell division protein FtsB